MIEKINYLREIATAVGSKEVLRDLEYLEKRNAESNQEIIIPFVGEFSSGKTTLLNSLTDAKILETAVLPTTATIYRIHFGRDKCYAQVLEEDGKLTDVEDIKSLKNENLGDTAFVNIYDTSTQLPSSTVLVDTPGLSSSDPRHKQALVNFLPFADAVILVTDINQQITRSLLDFTKLMEMTKTPIYLVITKCDMKHPSEVDKAKQYIKDNIKLPIDHIVAVSAVNNNMKELFTLFNQIQQNKNSIIATANENRIRKIEQGLLRNIDELLDASKPDKSIENIIREQEYQLKSILRSVHNIINQTEEEITSAEKRLYREFEDTIQTKLDYLVEKYSPNLDTEVESTINNVSSLLVAKYQDIVREIVREKIKSYKSQDDNMSLDSLRDAISLDFSIDAMNYNLDLANIAQYGDTIQSVVDAGIFMINPIAGLVNMAAGSINKANNNSHNNNNAVQNNTTNNKVANQRTPEQKAARQKNVLAIVTTVAGFIPSIANQITEKTLAKPQRKREIRNYINNSLAPEFKTNLHKLSTSLISKIEQNLIFEMEEKNKEKKQAIMELKQEQAENKTEFEKRITALKNYKKELSN